jgi:hypothetical protein
MSYAPVRESGNQSNIDDRSAASKLVSRLDFRRTNFEASVVTDQRTSEDDWIEGCWFAEIAEHILAKGNL